MDGCWQQLELFDDADLWLAEPLPAPATLAEHVAAGRGARRLLARVLYQALVDESLLQENALPDKYWPWNGEWAPREELDAFWQSDTLEWLCDWLDRDIENVLELTEGIRDGTQHIETDKRRKAPVV